MANVLRYPNLGEISTGTTVSTAHCLDVAPKNTAATPLFVSEISAAGSVLETRYHDAAATNVNGSAGAFIEIETAANVANTISRVFIASTMGEPLAFSKGANAAAAALAGNRLYNLSRGEGTTEVPVSLVAGDKLWVRSLSTTSVTSGELILNLVG